MYFARYALLVCSIGLLGGATAPATQPASGDPIRQFLWGRKDVFGSSYPFMVDAPLYWGKYLIDGESHARMMALLDDVNAKSLDQVAPTAQRRALMQSELWQVFDYTIEDNQPDQSARIELRKKLAAAIRKLAMTKEQIQSLPDNLASFDGPGAPPNVQDPRSGWVDIDMADARVAAPQHTQAFDGRSVFGVFMRLPGGSDATNAYLRRLGARAATPQPSHDPLPQFPDGTQLALLRRMVLIDSAGEPVCSPIVQSLQIRSFTKVVDRWPAKRADVRMQEFVLHADRYAVGDRDAMHAIGALEYEPLDQFEHPALSPFDMPPDLHPPTFFRATHPRLSECYICHNAPGVDSMRSIDDNIGLIRGPAPDTKDREIRLTIEWTQQRSSWGLLRGYWEAIPR